MTVLSQLITRQLPKDCRFCLIGSEIEVKVNLLGHFTILTKYVHCSGLAKSGQSLFLMSHPDVSLVNIFLLITRVSLVQNKCVFCQLRVHYIGDSTLLRRILVYST